MLHINNTNCKHCEGTGTISDHGAFGESVSYSCGCGFDFETINEVKELRKRLKNVIKRMEKKDGE